MVEKPRILLVEDDQGVRNVYAEFLSGNYDVSTANDGEEGWLMAKSNKYNLILLDIMMPKLDGLGFLKRRLDDTQVKNTPVIILTNVGSDRALRECFKMDVKYCIIKAETVPDKVIDLVAKALKE